ncbi:hypothetical protein AMEX_G15011, partial [Astyanax mexicanus]
PDVSQERISPSDSSADACRTCSLEMNAPNPTPPHSVLWHAFWNSSRTTYTARRLLQEVIEKEELYYTDYVPPARDTITVPKYVIYILIGVVVVVAGMYGITGHLIKDLLHDLADWLFGPNLEEEEVVVVVEAESLESSGGEERAGERRVRWGRRITEVVEEKRTILPGIKLSVTS